MSIVARGLGRGSHATIVVTAGYGLRAVAAPPFIGGGFRHRPSETRRDRRLDDDEIILLMFAQAVASGAIQ